MRATLLLGFMAAGCSCSNDEPSSDAGTGGSTSTGSGAGTATWTTDGGDGGAGGSVACLPEPSPPEPCPGWPGWETWDDFSSKCPFCVPASEAALPEPIEWEPCPVESGWPADACRWMKVTWPWEVTPFTAVADVDTTVPGKTYVRVTRVSVPEDRKTSIVAEADGPVRFAMLRRAQISEDGCLLGFSPFGGSMQHGKLVGHVHNDHVGPTTEDFPGVVWGASVGELRPRVLAYAPETGGYIPTTSDTHWGNTDVYSAQMARWDEPSCPSPLETVFTSAEAGGLQQVGLLPWHDFALWGSSDLYHQGVMAWTPDKGAYPFLTFPGDWSRGVGGIGLDGVDMVWTYSEGKATPGGPYATRSVMTSPFTTDPAELEPRRLRSYPSDQAIATRWAVGCGYAAIIHSTNLGAVIIVRLSDGVSWTLDPPCGVGGWCYGSVYAVTCDEVFLRATMGAMNMARIRLDALGPGIPPD